MLKKTIKDIDVKGKVCIVRVDFNVKLDNDGNILDDERIRASLSTIYNLIGRGAKIILISHLGRPKGKESSTSLSVVIDRLKVYIQQDHFCLADLDDEKATRSCVERLANGEVMMFENIRWYTGEKDDIDGFGKYLASFGDIFVNDGFGVSHREDASVVGIPKYLPSVAGLLLADEIKYMELTVNRKQARPFVAVIGGKKAEEKIGVTSALLKKVDDILLGGGIVNTFLKARGCDIGASFHEPDMVDEVREIMRNAMDKPCGLVLPKDVVVTDKIAHDATHSIVDYDQIPHDMMAVDIGPKTAEKYQRILKKAGFILWIGPMGIYEIPAFRTGNDAIMDAIAESDASSFVGGGDTIASVAHHPKKEYISHKSTGGGATLKFLEFGTLPGIDVLDSKE